MLAKPRTFAQVVATGPPEKRQGIPINHQTLSTDKDSEKIKQQREKLTITITAATAPDTTKNQLKSMHAKELTQKCQSAITEQFKEGHIPKIHGVNKLSNDTYRFHCESKEDPQLLKEMDWSSIFSGAMVYKRKYGLVIHGVPKKDLDPTTTEENDTSEHEIEEENASRNLHVEKITPLRRSQKHLNRIAAHHSIVIFTNSAEEADECIRQGMFIKRRFYSPEKYTPQHNITQCFKCYKFGHLAKQCKSEQKCGNCGDKKHTHEAEECHNDTKCIGCSEPHPARHIECRKRDEEGSRLEEQKTSNPSRFYNE